jgi:hypothetical protein
LKHLRYSHSHSQPQHHWQPRSVLAGKEEEQEEEEEEEEEE